MCNFHSIIICRDGTIEHTERSSHSEAAQLAKRGENEPHKPLKFWEWEWDGTGEFSLEKHLRNHEQAPEIVARKAMSHAKKLKAALEEGKHFESYFADRKWNDVKRMSKKFIGAIECADGGKEWYRNGQRHRDDGPAIEYADGRKYWYRNGQRHRDDGPAIECADGGKEWYRNGKFVK